MSDKTWRARVPLRVYDDFIPYIERMKRGETDVLWPGRCSFFSISAGTTSGNAKHLPVTDALLSHFRRVGLESLLCYTARAGLRVARGKVLVLGGPTTLAPLLEARKPPAFAGSLGGILALALPAWAERRFYEPGPEVAQLPDSHEKLQATARHCLDRDVRMIVGLPCQLPGFANIVLAEHAARTGTPARSLRDVWPRLECVVHGGVPIGPFARELRAVCGPGVHLHEVYFAAEGFFGAQDSDAEVGLRLFTDAGVYFEFLPLADYDESRLAQLGPRAVGLEGVRAGVDYVLVVTTRGGLCRYVIGDIVRFGSTEPPRITYAGRTELRLGSFDENVIERELTEALTNVCARNGWQVVNFHVAPRFANSLTSLKRGAHEWWLELRAGSEITPTGPVIAPLLDAELQRLNPAYAARRKEGNILPPTVRLVMPGVFDQWLRAGGRWGGLNRMPRCRGDRLIADELARYAPFHDAA